MPKQAVAAVLHNWRHETSEIAKQEILDDIGDLSKMEIYGAQILVTPYVRPKKTAGGIIITETSQKEDNWQGKVALVLKIGPTAFLAGREAQFGGRFPQVGDWIFHDVKACFMCHVKGDGGKNGREGRLVYANDIYGRLQDLTPVV